MWRRTRLIVGAQVVVVVGRDRACRPGSPAASAGPRRACGRHCELLRGGPCARTRESCPPRRPPATAIGRCAACGADGLVPHFRVRGEIGEEGLIPTTKDFGTALGDIVRCPACGHMQLDRFPSEEELDARVRKARLGRLRRGGGRASAPAPRCVLEQVERYASPGRLLDVGCWVGLPDGGGRATAAGRPSASSPALTPPSTRGEQLGLDVRTDDLFDGRPAERASFDAVVLGDVLEHLTRAGDALEHVATLIKPGGVLVPAAAGRRQPGGAAARQALVVGDPDPHPLLHPPQRGHDARRHGYESAVRGHRPEGLHGRYYLNKGGVYLPGLSRRLVAMAERLGFADRMFVPDFRDRMVMIARPARR